MASAFVLLRSPDIHRHDDFRFAAADGQLDSAGVPQGSEFALLFVIADREGGGGIVADGPVDRRMGHVRHDLEAEHDRLVPDKGRESVRPQLSAVGAQPEARDGRGRGRLCRGARLEIDHLRCFLCRLLGLSDSLLQERPVLGKRPEPG